ncbi:hypothetical protein OOU_Y34scaffold00021g32 [Pyricularia oryzae Y34]|uniref:Uncharacterized protein n=2 Tax=Pyricularia oryzae TaxID=318829 RepID=A0AA97PS97_PYRO3|nr:hypothetical protein OOU_Y34scaffold00021g32 [Pyricularia oryzae Y34]
MNRTSSKRAPGPDTAATAAPTRQCTPDGSDANDDRVSALVAPLGGSIHSPEQQSVGYMLCQGHNSEYLANYISEIALWLDMFDSQRAFGVQVPLLARSTPALILELYQEAIRLVGSLLEIRDPSVVPICTILCVMEMMSVSAQDLCGALISDGTQSTLVPLCQLAPSVAIDNPQGVATLFCTSKDPDMYANYAVYLCSKRDLPNGQVGSQVYHAKRICGISQTNPHQGCLNNAIQSLWLAGHLMSHPVEHKVVVELIRDIEATTGWGTSWRIPDLKVALGFGVE